MSNKQQNNEQDETAITDETKLMFPALIDQKRPNDLMQNVIQPSNSKVRGRRVSLKNKELEEFTTGTLPRIQFKIQAQFEAGELWQGVAAVDDNAVRFIVELSEDGSSIDVIASVTVDEHQKEPDQALDETLEKVL